MRVSLIFFFILLLCNLYRAQGHSRRGAVSSKDASETKMFKSEETDEKLEPEKDIGGEVGKLRDLVSAQAKELKLLSAKVAESDSRMTVLQEEITAMKNKVTAAETLVKKMQTEGETESAKLSATQQKLDSVEERLLVNIALVEEVKEKQEAKLAESDSRMKVLQEEITVMKDKVTAAETLVKEMEMKGEAESAELSMTQQKVDIVQERLLVNIALVEELQEKHNVSKVAFSSSLLVSGEGNTFYIDYTTMVFRNVITNIGNHYHPITGFFTAPVRGVYYFRFTAHIAHSKNVNMGIRMVKNNDFIVLSGDRATTTTDPEDNVSNGVVLELQVGDLIALQLKGNAWDDHHHRTTFGGFLLFAL